MTDLPWKTQKSGLEEALRYMKGRMDGVIKSIKTPWFKFDDAGTAGIEWNTMVVIAGRPGAGKTLVKDQIIRELPIRNQGEDIRVLEFSFEMMARTSAIREFSGVIGKSYKQLCSAENKLDEQTLQSCYTYAQSRVVSPIDIVEEACEVSQFGDIIEKYMDTHSIMECNEGKSKRIYKKTLITLDHTMLVRKAAFEKGTDTLYALGEKITSLKRKYPIAFIILSQLNRNIDSPERNEDGKYSNYINESDVFGADAMNQHTDLLVGLNRPAKQKIRYYGPDRYIIDDETILAMHFLKCRNGDTRMSFFKAEFDKMRILEIPTPPTANKKLRT